jgi:ribose transport system substrate-binding protein
VEGAYKRSESLLSRYRQRDGSLAVDAIFCVNESSSRCHDARAPGPRLGRQDGFVGFDASESLVKRLADGHIDALVVQDPVKMGYLGVTTMVSHLRGEPVEKRIDTGVNLATRENMEDPEIHALLQPDLSRGTP